MNIAQLHELFLTMTLVNFGLLAFSALVVVVFKKQVCSLHGKMFGLSEEVVRLVCYVYVAAYKILIIVFNLVPLLALNMML